MMILLRVLVGLAVLGIGLLLVAGAVSIGLFLLAVAVKVLVLGALAYLVIRIVSPNTASRLRDRMSDFRLRSRY